MERPYKVTYGVSIATPIYQQNTLFVTGYWEGSKAIRLGPNPADAKIIWQENQFLRGLMTQPLYRDGHVYMIDKTFGLTCFELETGRKLWDDQHQVAPRPQSAGDSRLARRRRSHDHPQRTGGTDPGPVEPRGVPRTIADKHHRAARTVADLGPSGVCRQPCLCP